MDSRTNWSEPITSLLKKPPIYFELTGHGSYKELQRKTDGYFKTIIRNSGLQQIIN